MNYEHNNLSPNSNNITKDIRSDLEPIAIKDGLSYYYQSEVNT